MLHFDGLELRAWALLGIRGRAGSGLKAICTNTILFYVLLTILFSGRMLLSSTLRFISKDLTVSSYYRWKYPGNLRSTVKSRESSAPDGPFAASRRDSRNGCGAATGRRCGGQSLCEGRGGSCLAQHMFWSMSGTGSFCLGREVCLEPAS